MQWTAYHIHPEE